MNINMNPSAVFFVAHDEKKILFPCGHINFVLQPVKFKWVSHHCPKSWISLGFWWCLTGPYRWIQEGIPLAVLGLFPDIVLLLLSSQINHCLTLSPFCVSYLNGSLHWKIMEALSLCIPNCWTTFKMYYTVVAH